MKIKIKKTYCLAYTVYENSEPTYVYRKRYHVFICNEFKGSFPKKSDAIKFVIKAIINKIRLPYIELHIS